MAGLTPWAAHLIVHPVKGVSDGLGGNLLACDKKRNDLLVAASTENFFF